MVHFVLPIGKHTIVIGEKMLWRITDDGKVHATDSSIANAKCASMDSKNRFFIGTTDGKIYVSENCTDFSLKYLFSDNGLEENKE